MHLQETFDLTLTQGQGHISIAIYIMWLMYLQSLKLLGPMVKEMHYQENTLFDLDTKVKGVKAHKMLPSTLNIMWLWTSKVWYCYIPRLRKRCIYKTIHYMTVTFGSRQGHMKCCLVPSTSCDLCTYRVWSYYVKRFRRRSIYKKIQYLTFDLDLGVKVTQNLPSTFYIMWPVQLQSLKLLCQKV